MRQMVTIFLLILPYSFLLAQSTDIESHIGQLVQQGDESENSHYYDLLLYYYDNPINLNATNREELNQLDILTSEQIDDIFNHITATGNFRSIYELQALPSFNHEVIAKIRPFVTVSGTQSLKSVIGGISRGQTNYATAGYSRVMERSRAYKEQVYTGSPDRAQLRLRLRNPGHLSIGLAAQKDPGEDWLSQSSIPTPDYLSGHIFLENQGRVKQLVLGDYRLQFGQGLLLGASFMVGKNIETVTSVKQPTLGILPYSSITESNFFRGLGATIAIASNWQVSAFYSNQYLDATPVRDSTQQAVSAIRTGGLHRTASEIAAANQLHEQVWGSAVAYNRKNFNTGLVMVSTQFDKPIIPADRPYNQYRFRGNELLNFSWFGQATVNNFLFFGEVAKTHQAGMGVNIGLIGSVSKYVSLSLLYRSFAKDFHSFYGLPFSERSSIGNEQGMYWGIKIHPLAGMTIAAYYDMYRFPWLTANTAAPTNGNDYLLRAEYRINDQTKMFVQMRTERAETKESLGNIAINQPIKLVKTIFNIDYNLENPLTFRTRLQFNRFNASQAEDGWLVYQDINYDRMQFGLTARISGFYTDSYAARQYVYEKDMLFTFNTRMYNGQGMSYYLIGRIRPLPGLTLRAKIAYVHYFDTDTIGSGYDVIAGNHKTQITAQLHYRF